MNLKHQESVRSVKEHLIKCKKFKRTSDKMIKVDVCYRRSSLSKYNLIVLFWQQQPVDVNQIIKKNTIYKSF